MNKFSGKWWTIIFHVFYVPIVYICVIDEYQTHGQKQNKEKNIKTHVLVPVHVIDRKRFFWDKR